MSSGDAVLSYVPMFKYQCTSSTEFISSTTQSVVYISLELVCSTEAACASDDDDDALRNDGCSKCQDYPKLKLSKI